METLILYILLVLIVSLAGKAYGRGMGTFLVSLILSPLIGLIYVLIMPKAN